MHCNVRKVLLAIVREGAQTMSEIKQLVPGVRKPESKVSTLIQSGCVEIGADGQYEPTPKGTKIAAP